MCSLASPPCAWATMIKSQDYSDSMSCATANFTNILPLATASTMSKLGLKLTTCRAETRKLWNLRKFPGADGVAVILISLDLKWQTVQVKCQISWECQDMLFNQSLWSKSPSEILRSTESLMTAIWEALKSPIIVVKLTWLTLKMALKQEPLKFKIMRC